MKTKTVTGWVVSDYPLSRIMYFTRPDALCSEPGSLEFEAAVYMDREACFARWGGEVKKIRITIEEVE